MQNGVMRTATVVSVWVVAGCSAGAERAPSQATAPSVTDAEIAAIVVTANTIDAEAGDLAVTRASSEEVRAFAKTMATDHRAVNAQAGALVTRLGVVPVTNAVSEKLKVEAATVQADLSKKSGADFDRAYIAREVAYHRAVIEAVDQLLIPSARNAELKQTLISVRPAFVAHLRHAEQLQQSLK
jgi:putative membrane protein